MDPNAYNIGAYNAGTTNDLAGLADGTGYFGASANTNDIFGQTLTTNTDTTDFGGVQTLGATTDTNTYYGDANFTQGTTFDTNAYDPNLYGGAQVLPGTTTDVNALYGQTTDMGGLYGTTQGITAYNPDGNVGYGTTGTYGTTLNTTNLLPGTTTTATTTTTQTTYDTTGMVTSPGVVTGVNDLTTYGTPIDYTVPTALPVTTTTAVPATTAVTTVTQPVATLPPPVATVTTPVATVTPPVATVTTPVASVTTPVATVTTPVATVTPPVATVNPLLTGQPLLRNNLPYYASPDGQILQTRYGQKIFDEDFRRGRPMYNYVIGQKLLTPNDIAIRPSYNIGLTNNHLVYDYPNSINNLALKRNNLDRLGRGGSYDVYGRGITPLLNKVGLGTVETQPRLKDFL